MSLLWQHLLLGYFKTLTVNPARVSIHDHSHSDAQSTEPTGRRLSDEPDNWTLFQQLKYLDKLRHCLALIVYRFVSQMLSDSQRNQKKRILNLGPVAKRRAEGGDSDV